MKSRVRIGVVLLLLAVAGLVAWRYLRPSEPLYQGKPLSFWLKDRNPFSMEEKERVDMDQAFRHIGSNAIPSLLRMLRAKDSVLKLKLVGLAQKQHLIPIHYVRAEVRHGQAIYGFTFMGAEARNALPDLIQTYENSTSSASQCATATILAGLGPDAEEALPALLRGMNTTNETLLAVTIYAIGTLNLVHPHSELVVPSLVKSLRHPSQFVRANAAMALAHFGPAAKEAVAVLKELETDPDTTVRDHAAYALKVIDPQTTNEPP